MRACIIALLAGLIVYPGGSVADTEREGLYRNEISLRDSFERPLRLELLQSGFTPRNAETAAQFMLNSLIECWNSERNLTSSSEQETIIFQLGGQTIVTYETPCMNQFLADVREIAR